ncbi:MAG: right-handed parallel beta-helix repeat-containing protein, partial [Candidatus Thorarchaeota archaeon]
YGLAVYYCPQLVIRNTSFHDNAAQGLYLYGCDDTLLLGINSYNNGWMGLQIRDTDGVTIQDSEFFNNSAIGVEIFQTHNVIFTENSVYENVHGVAPGFTSFSDNEFNGTGVRVYNSNYLTFTNNYVFNNSGYGVNLDVTDYSSLYDNRIGWNQRGNAIDTGTNNKWYSQTLDEMGNFWSDYNGVGPYAIPPASATDQKPILWEFDSPEINNLENTTFYEADTKIINWTVIDATPGRYTTLVDSEIFASGVWDTETISVDLSELPVGIYNITLFVEDLNGNNAVQQLFLTVIADLDSTVTQTDTTTQTGTTTQTDATTQTDTLPETPLLDWNLFIIGITTSGVILVVVIIIGVKRKS